MNFLAIFENMIQQRELNVIIDLKKVSLIRRICLIFHIEILFSAFL